MKTSILIPSHIFLYILSIAILLFSLACVSSRVNSNRNRMNHMNQEELFQEWKQALFLEHSKKETSGLSLLAGGDIHFSWGVAKYQKKYGLISPIKSIMPLFYLSDIRALNLETALSLQGIPLKDKAYIFNGDPSNIDLLKALNINLVFLGNNHSMDMSGVGLEETIIHLKKAGIESVGAGINEKEAMKAYIFRKDSVSYAIVSFSLIGPNSIFSKKNKKGVASFKALKYLKALRRQVDQLIVSVHWGREYYIEPIPLQKNWARLLIDQYQADLVIGHHPHFRQNIEIYKDKVILYSLGNFLFGSSHFRLKNNILAFFEWDKQTLENEKEKTSLRKVWLIPIYGKSSEEGSFVRLLHFDELENFWKGYSTLLITKEEELKDKFKIMPSGLGLIQLF